MNKSQKGLSLIELMIGILLGALIITVVLYILAGSRASSQMIEAESRMQDNIQYAVEVLNSTIRQAGYVSDPRDGYKSIIVGTEPGDIIHGTEGGDDTTPDTITVYYQGNSDNAVANCLGTPIAEEQLSMNKFSISTDGALQCETSTATGTGTETHSLIGGIGGVDTGGTDSRVTNLQILYGLDQDNSGSVNQYKTIDQISPGDREQIIAVSIQITLEERVGADTLAKTFTSAVHLRNRI